MNFADLSGLNRLMCDVYTDYGCAGSGGVGWYMYTTYWYGPEGSSAGGGGGFFPGGPGGAGDPVGGDGGGPSFDSKYKGQANLAVAGLHTPCKDAFGKLGISIGALSAQALNTTYVNASLYDSNDKTLTQHLFFGNGNFTNINAAGSGTAYVPTTRDGTQLPDVVLRAQFFLDLQNDPYKAQVTLVHELLHITLKKDDDELAQFLGIHDNQPSPAITEWLQNDCPGAK